MIEESVSADSEEEPAALVPQVPLELFDTAAINAMTADTATVDVWDLGMLFGRASEQASAEGRDNDAAAYRLLTSAVSTVLRPSETGAQWGSRVSGPFHRSPLPQDFGGAQSAVLAQLAPLLEHAGLRARIADLAWVSNHKLGEAAGVAIAAYCECVERLVDGRGLPRFGASASAGANFEALGYGERALQLGHLTQKKRVQPERTIATHQLVYRSARDGKVVTVFARAAELGLYYGLLDQLQVAADAELVAQGDPRPYSALAARAVLDLASHLYGQVGDVDAQRRCQLAAVDKILAMRKEVTGAGAEAHWVQTALFALRHIKDTGDQRRELRRELRDLQEDSLGDFAQFSVPLDVGNLRDAMLRAFGALPLPVALRELACLSRSRPVDELRRDALEGLEQHPLSAMMSMRYSDVDGKDIAQSPSASPGEEPDEGWFKATMNRNESFRRQIIIMGRFEPAREAILSRFDISERHLLPIVLRSPFVRQEQVGLMALGFTRLLQGDYRSAVHLLVPQLEPSLRYLLRLAGHDPTIDFDDMTEENCGLPALLDRLRPQLEEIMPAELVLEIDLLFHHRTGSALRHTVAHGLIGAGGCFSFDAIYACWLMYQLTCLPLLERWDRSVAPAIEAEIA